MHFNRTGSQSSLQRCADIGVLLNPMILCFSMRAGNYEVTDGWWWTEAVLDPPLMDLIRQVSSKIFRLIYLHKFFIF